MLPDDKLKQIAEAVLFAIGAPLSADQVIDLFPDEEKPDRKQVKAVLDQLAEDYQGRGIELREVGSGYRFQVRVEFAPWVTRLWEEKPPRYSRALLETLALIAYRQPITRGEIEDVRGVAVSTNIMKLLTEREWVRVVGHRDVPGKPALYATTREFLDYFNLSSLADLPSLQEIRDLDSINRELELGLRGEPAVVPLEGETESADETDEGDRDTAAIAPLALADSGDGSEGLDEAGEPAQGTETSAEDRPHGNT